MSHHDPFVSRLACPISPLRSVRDADGRAVNDPIYNTIISLPLFQVTGFSEKFSLHTYTLHRNIISSAESTVPTHGMHVPCSIFTKPRARDMGSIAFCLTCIKKPGQIMGSRHGQSGFPRPFRRPAKRSHPITCHGKSCFN
jgi:hypothetical protein